ncbi:hypothetical protein MMC13_005842 [Lambiella insularis]|nr:hypothetical protein [Lambiella insularis]
MESYGPSPLPMYSQGPSSFEATLTTAEYVKGLPSYTFPGVSYSNASLSRDDGYPYAAECLGPRRMVSYPVTYNETFQEMVDQPVPDPPSPQVPGIEKGNKLLSFQRSTCNFGLLDYAMRQTSVSLSAQLHGMFFLAKSSRTGSDELSVSTAELTCYRRNLFQITGYVTLPRVIQYVVTDQGEQLPIISQELSISASESVEGSTIKIISVPFKPSTTGASPTAEDKAEKEPTTVPLDQSSSHELDGDFSVYPFAWKRLQFRVATANNGRRKELQQHFTIRLSVSATLANGAKVSICQALSGPVVVRGRSPRNFQTKEDVPLPDSRPPGRKNMSSPSISRRFSTGQIQPQVLSAHEMTTANSDAFQYTQPQSGHVEWRNFSPSSTTTLPSSTLPSTPSVSPYVQHQPELTKNRKASLKRKSSHADTTAPIMLSIPTERDTQQSRSAPPERPRKASRHSNMAFPQQSFLPPNIPTTLPITTFNFASTISAPSFATNATATTNSIDPAGGFYGYHSGVEDWVYPAESQLPHP